MKNLNRRAICLATLMLILSLTSACATRAVEDPVYDPLEKINRGIFAFNNKLDDYVIRPAAITYRSLTPNAVELGVSNFFSNLEDINVVVNDVLQGKFKQATSDLGRFAVNSTVGVFGVFDIGSRIGLEKNFETWGQTFGHWGIAEGPFIMLPLFGPSNLRATVGQVAGTYTTYPRYVNDRKTVFAVRALEIITLRAPLLSSIELVNQASLDPYIFIRDFWSRRHRQQTLDVELLVDLDEDELEQLDNIDSL